MAKNSKRKFNELKLQIFLIIDRLGDATVTDIYLELNKDVKQKTIRNVMGVYITYNKYHKYCPYVYVKRRKPSRLTGYPQNSYALSKNGKRLLDIYKADYLAGRPIKTAMMIRNIGRAARFPVD
jgi:hypothetical protein